jgi:murein L,D-transpeptidase YcbB/YkuD
MRGAHFAAILLLSAGALALGAGASVRAEEPASAGDPQSPSGPASPMAADQPGTASEPSSATPEGAEPSAAATGSVTEAPAARADPVVEIIRAKLADAAITKGFNADDVGALQAYYAARSGGPLWMTEMGLSAKGQAILFEIARADDWGLDASAFDLPKPGALPTNGEAEALDEIKLDLAMLKYARYARGGRFDPQAVSKLYDQVPPVRNPATVLTEIEAADAPDGYLRSLQPKHQEFERLRQALLAARGKSEGEAKKGDDKEVKRLIINMERWRWLPQDLGSVYVWNNAPEFMLYVVKDGKRVYADKTLVGTSNYATPVFTADMKTIVFNPDWVAPETVVTENLLPHLSEGNYSILKTHKLSVSYQGQPVDVSRVKWTRSNILSYTFSQRGGPSNVLGKVKFLYPNRHTVYMHDTLPVRKKWFKESVRMIGHECVRMEKPDKFAQVLLAADKGWSESKVKELWDNGLNAAVSIEGKIPVHMVYFTAVAGDDGKVSTFRDVYGLDRKLAAALFGDTTGFPPPPPDTSGPTDTQQASSAPRPSRRDTGGTGIAASLGFLDD